MRKATRNYLLDAVQGLLFLAQATSGSVLWFVLPRSHSGQGWGLSRGAYDSTFIFARHTWLDIHKYLAVALLVAVIVHLTLHRQWVISMTKSYFRERNKN